MSERTVAALYIDPRGPYPVMDGVDCWDEARDARKYSGPWPVVAHPPCATWGTLRSLCDRAHERELGLRAVEQVRLWGGVLEQPEHSGLFTAAGIPTRALVRVDQVAWGHVARKSTWLYFVGIPLDLVFRTMRRGGVPTHWCSGVHTQGARGKPPPGIKICSAEQRRRTPPAFAERLVSLARAHRVVGVAS